MTAVTKEKSATDAPAPEAARTVPLIDPKCVKLNFAGHCWNEFEVRLPQGFTTDDLSSQRAWKRVQGSHYALKRLDRLTLISYSEDWMAEARVDAGTTDSATLIVGRTHSMSSRDTQLLEDTNYKLRWFGTGYATERKSDGQRVTAIVPTLALAEADFRRMYPTQGARVA